MPVRPPARPAELIPVRTRDGASLRVRTWPAAGDERGVLLYLHGIQSHGGWYEWSGAALSEQGWRVIMPDRRGSGAGDGASQHAHDAAPGDVRRATQWLDDIDDVLHELAPQRDAADKRRLALLGVSWGGKLALAYALRGALRVDGLVLVAPGVKPRVDVPLRQKLAIATARLFSPRRRFDIPLQDPALFTDDPEGQAFIRDDPHKLTRATARFLFASRTLDRLLASAPRGALQTPLLLLLAGHDRIIHNDRTRRAVERLLSTPTVLHEARGAAHSLEFEADSSWLDEVARFLASHADRAGEASRDQ